MTSPMPDYAGLRQYRRARSTGTLVGVYDGEEAGMDTDDGRQPWSTVCEPHGTVCSHPSLKLAQAHAPHPEGWCETCATLGDIIPAAAGQCRPGEAALILVCQMDGPSVCVTSEASAHSTAQSAGDGNGFDDVLLAVAVVTAAGDVTHYLNGEAQ